MKVTMEQVKNSVESLVQQRNSDVEDMNAQLKMVYDEMKKINRSVEDLRYDQEILKLKTEGAVNNASILN